MRSLRLLVAPIVLASPFAAGCGHDSPAVPASAIVVVGDRTIARVEFDALMAQSKDSYRRSGRTFPAPGTPAYAELRDSAVRLLVERAELEQKAPGLGVTVDGGQVENQRKLLIEQTFGGSEATYRARLRAVGMTDAQVRDALRAQLLSEAVFQAVTADVDVPTADVKRYYEAHLKDYESPTGRIVRTFAQVRESIRRRLLSQARAERFNRWLAGVRAEFARKTAYAEGFAPSG